MMVSGDLGFLVGVGDHSHIAMAGVQALEKFQRKGPNRYPVGNLTLERRQVHPQLLRPVIQ